MPRPHHLKVALSNHGFRRLYAIRLASQFGDGVFQASLAGAVLFNPERQAHAADIAAGFAVLLLPYSLLGPFAGVLLDRWWRQRVLVLANIARAIGVLLFASEVLAGINGLAFYASALVLVSLSRFVLSALSASLPRVVPRAELVTANALSTTSGALVAATGGASAIAVRALVGDNNLDYAIIAAVALIPYLIAAGSARGFARPDLGPLAVERDNRETLGAVVRGLGAGARHVYECKPVLYGLATIGVHRLAYGVSTVCTLLLYRNYFHNSGPFRAGLTGLGQIVAAVAIGGGIAALVTPTAFRHFGPVRWPAALLAVAGAIQLTLGLPYLIGFQLLAALLLGFVSQGIKIAVDTLVQEQIGDSFRGRVFSLYDTLFNVTLVVAALLTATVLPEDGHSPTSVVIIAVGYALSAFGYLTIATRTGTHVSDAARTTARVR